MLLVACGGGGGGSGPTGNTDTRYSVYRWSADSETYELTITEIPSKALVQANGIKNGTYVLVIIAGATTHTSAGTASASGNNVTLKPDSNHASDSTFTITIVSATNITIPAGEHIKVGTFDKTFTTQTTPDTTGPFDLTASELNLTAGTVATSFASSLETKWTTANGPDDKAFYPLTKVNITTSGTTPELGHTDVAVAGVPIRFYINSSNELLLYGSSGDSTTTRIRYDLVVIRKSDGKGWFKQGSDQTVPAGPTLTGSLIVADSRISLSNLTGGKITNKTGLIGSGNATNPDYWVYAIIRYVGASGDFNSSRSDRNVIKVYPDPEGK